MNANQEGSDTGPGSVQGSGHVQGPGPGPGPGTSSGTAPAWSLILYDGVCGLCDRFVSFVLRRDRRGRFRFAALQSPYAQNLLAAKGKVIEVERLETLVVVTPAGEILERSAAVFWVLRGVGGGWGMLSWLRAMPQGLIDWGYDQIARRRLRIWGQLPACRIPSPEERTRFLDASVDA